MVEAAPRTRVFISYSRKDQAFVDLLAQALDAKGYDTLLDREDISGGEAWKERLDALILRADVVVFVVSPDSVASPICGWETLRTVELGKRLIPLCLKRIDDDLVPAQLARLNYIFVDDDALFEQALSRLYAACDVDIAWVREHTRLVELASHWNADGRKDAALQRSEVLAASEAWLGRRQPLAPVVPEVLTAYLQASRASETAAFARERLRLRRMRRLQLGVGALVVAAAIIVFVAGLGAARLISGLGAQRAATLMELARVASDQGLYDRAARYALVALDGADTPFIGFDASGAESELRRAVAASYSAGVLLHHESPVRVAAYSPDGRRIVTASDDGSARVWDGATGRLLATLPVGVDDAVAEAAFSADGARIVTTSGNDAARVWDATTGRELAVFRVVDGFVSSASFSPDGARVLFVADDTARVWDMASRREIITLRGHERDVQSAAFSRDGQRIVTASVDETARIWDATNGREIAVLRGHQRRVLSAAFSPDGARVVTVSDDRTARLWNALTAQEIAVISGGGGAVRGAAFSPDSARLATAADEETSRVRDRASGLEEVTLSGIVRVWEAASGAEVAVLRGHGGSVRDLAFSPGGERIVTGSRDGTARIWDTNNGHELAALRGHEGPANAAAFSPDGRHVVTASNDGTVRVWSAAANVTRRLEGHTGRVTAAGLGRSGALIVTASEDGAARVWDAARRRSVAVLAGHEAPVLGVAFAANDGRVVTFSDNSVRVWDAASGRQISLRQGYEGAVRAFSPDATQFATAADFGVVRLLNTQSDEEIALRGHAGEIASVVFSHDASRVVTTSLDQTARVWDTASGREIAVLAGHTDFVLTAAASANGALIVTASTDNTARVWEAASGREIALLRGHEGAVFNAAFNADASRVVTASDDGTVRVWDSRNGRQIGTLRGHQGPVQRAVFGANGTRVVSLLAHDGTMRVWDVQSGREVAVLRGPDGFFSSADGISPDLARMVVVSGSGEARIWELHPALSAARPQLRRLTCSSALSGGVANFSDSDYRAAPLLDRALDVDACASPSPWSRLGVYLGFATDAPSGGASPSR